MKSYSELAKLQTFQERLNYLKEFDRAIGTESFGWHRYANQALYRSTEWKRIRDRVIFRDNGLDLGINPVGERERLMIHHINPITYDDILARSPCLFDIDNLITVTHNTHNLIHYGDTAQMPDAFVERKPGDTSPWKEASV